MSPANAEPSSSNSVTSLESSGDISEVQECLEPGESEFDTLIVVFEGNFESIVEYDNKRGGYKLEDVPGANQMPEDVLNDTEIYAYRKGGEGIPLRGLMNMPLKDEEGNIRGRAPTYFGEDENFVEDIESAFENKNALLIYADEAYRERLEHTNEYDGHEHLLVIGSYNGS